MSAGTRVVVLSEDPVGATMGGAAIRAYEIARALAATATVTLIAPGTEPPEMGGARHVEYVPEALPDLDRALAGADVVVLRPANPVLARRVSRCGARIVFDVCDPLTLDILEARATAPAFERELWNTLTLDHLLDALHRGHHFICAGERQRDLYLGMLLGSRLIAPAAYAADPSFRSFIDCVPFGIPSDAPLRMPGAGPRAQIPGLAGDVRLIVWNGGIWNWLDPVTAVAAMARAYELDPRVRLLFMFGGARDGEEGREARAARALARELGLLDRIVFFNAATIDYRQRASWLLDADCFLATHRDHLEATFSFRTRLLDCFWTGTPAVATEGGEMSAMIARAGGGLCVPAADPERLAAAILEVLARGHDGYRERLLEHGRALTWPAIIAPLRRMVELEGAPTALGSPLARRAANPARRGRAAATRLLRAVRRP